MCTICRTPNSLASLLARCLVLSQLDPYMRKSHIWSRNKLAKLASKHENVKMRWPGKHRRNQKGSPNHLGRSLSEAVRLDDAACWFWEDEGWLRSCWWRFFVSVPSLLSSWVSCSAARSNCAIRSSFLRYSISFSFRLSFFFSRERRADAVLLSLRSRRFLSSVSIPFPADDFFSPVELLEFMWRLFFSFFWCWTEWFGIGCLLKRLFESLGAERYKYNYCYNIRSEKEEPIVFLRCGVEILPTSD